MLNETYKIYKSGTDIRGVASEGVEGEPVNLTDEVLERIADGFILWGAQKIGKPADSLTVSVGRDCRISGEHIASVVTERLVRAVLNGLWISIGSFETGSFAPQSMGIMHYHSQALEILILITALLGIINYALYAELGKGNMREFFRNIETKTFFLWVTAVVIMGASAMASAGLLTGFDAILRRGLFAFVSAATNMGFSNLYPSQMGALLSSGSIFAIMLGMLVGGSSNSTSGGIKSMRVGILFKSIADALKSALSPDSAVSNASYHHLDRRLLTPELASSALTITLMYLFTYVLGAVLGLVCGYDASFAVFESISATSNTGLSSGLLQVGTPAFLKIFYMLQMWAGRLEFIMLFAVAYALLASIPFDKAWERLLRRWGRR